MDKRDVPAATARLVFGVWSSDDMPLAEAIWGDPLVTELIGGPFTTQAVARRLAREVENWRDHRMQYWPLFRRREGTLVGCCGLRPRDAEARVAELGFQLCREAWGHGFASEAAAAVIAWARAHDFAGLVAGHHPANLASRRALLRLGFAYTHDELYSPTRQMEPCYALPL